VTPELLKGEGDGRINVLLLGRGGGSHEAPDLTDTLMLASIDPVNNTATLLSLPRDFWVKAPDAGPTKINAIWESGKYKYLGKITNDNSDPKATLAGFAAVDEVVEGVIGVPIHYNVIVDFNAFKQAVDTVGGVTVNVPADLIDPTMAWENNRDPVIARAGIQKFDGKKALQYSRSRQTSNDFARSERQRAVLLALKEQVNTLGTLTNPAKLSSLATAFGSNVQTDLGLADAARLAQIIKNIDNTKVNSIGLADAPNNFITTANVNGQSVVQPKAGQFDYVAIQTYVRAQLKDPFLQQESAKIQVYNGTTVPGLASKQADVLKSYGYSITGTGNAPTQGYAQTVIVDLSGGTKKYTQRYLEQRYGVTVVTKLPDATILPNGADFVIIVGNDSTTINQG
jgi:LCP family protein required for cell wall assembly